MKMKELIDKRLSALTYEPNSPHTTGTRLGKRPLRIAIAATLCVMASFTVMTALLPGVNAMVAEVSPEAAYFLKPLRLTAKDLGMEVKVIGALHDEQNSVIYLTMRNMEDRSMLQFFKEYGFDINVEGSAQFTNSVVFSDPGIPKRTICVIAEEGEELDGKKITVRITSADGTWETTSRIRKTAQQLQKHFTSNIDGILIKGIYASPIGVSVVADDDSKEDMKKIETLDISVGMQDGSIVQCGPYPSLTITAYGFEATPSSHEYHYKYIPETPLDLDKIKEININNNTIPFLD